EEIANVTIKGGSAPRAELHYCPKTSKLPGVVSRIVAFLGQPAENGQPRSNGRVREPGKADAAVNGHAPVNGHPARNGHPASGAPPVAHPVLGPLQPEESGPGVAVATSARVRHGVVRYYRHEAVVTGWQVKSDHAGRLRLKHQALYRKKELC